MNAMAVTSLDKLFKPKSITVIGASDSEGSAGAILLRNLVNSGYSGNVYAITEQDLTIQEVQTYPALSALPERVEQRRYDASRRAEGTKNQV
jgi:acetyltransferase